MTGQLTYTNPPYTGVIPPSIQVPISASFATITGKNFASDSWTVPTTSGGTAIPVGNLSTPLGWFMIVNKDATNYVELLPAVSVSAFSRLYPGDFVMGRFAPGVTAPAMQAHTAPVNVTYLILEE